MLIYCELQYTVNVTNITTITFLKICLAYLADLKQCTDHQVTDNDKRILTHLCTATHNKTRNVIFGIGSISFRMDIKYEIVAKLYKIAIVPEAS